MGTPFSLARSMISLIRSSNPPSLSIFSMFGARMMTLLVPASTLFATSRKP